MTDRCAYFILFDYQLVADLLKVNHLIMSVFHSVPGVPRGKMERLERLFRQNA